MSTYNDIYNALNTKLNGISGIPTIQWPNTQQDPVAGTNYVRPTLLPAATDLLTLNDENMHNGLYQVDIFTSLKKGTSELMLLADKVRDGFNRQALTSGSTRVFVQQISVSPAQRVEGWWHCFVEVHYISVA